MNRHAIRLGLAAFAFTILAAGPLPAPTYGLNEGSGAPGPKNLADCKKALSDLDAEYVTRHLTLVREIKNRREAILTHCLSLKLK